MTYQLSNFISESSITVLILFGWLSFLSLETFIPFDLSIFSLNFDLNILGFERSNLFFWGNLATQSMIMLGTCTICSSTVLFPSTCFTFWSSKNKQKIKFLFFRYLRSLSFMTSCFLIGFLNSAGLSCNDPKMLLEQIQCRYTFPR